MNNLIPPNTYIESYCLNYFKDINFLFIQVIILNLIYFTFLKSLIEKIPEINCKIFTLKPKIILDTFMDTANFVCFGYFIIFNYNSFIMNKLDIIWFVVKIIVIIIIIMFLYINRKKLIEIFKNIKDEDDKNG